MNTISQLCSHGFAIPFAIALLLPGKRAVAAAAVVLPLTLWASLTGDSQPSIVGTLAGCSGGLLSGMRLRKLLPAMPRWAKSAASVTLAGSATLLVLPGSMAAEVSQLAHSANVTLRGWETRPPSDACFARKYAVTVAGATYHLPAAPILTIRAGRDSYHFQFNKSARSICASTGESIDPIHAENLSLDFSIPMRGPFCAAAGSGWSHELCSHQATAPHGAHPTLANIYSSEEYDRGHILSARSYADFMQSRDKARAAGHPFEPQKIGFFDRYANGYWVARSASWTNDDGEPFTLHCADAAQPGVLNCSTSYRLPAGPQLSYHFTAPANRLEPMAKEVDRNVHAMLAEFSAP